MPQLADQIDKLKTGRKSYFEIKRKLAGFPAKKTKKQVSVSTIGKWRSRCRIGSVDSAGAGVEPAPD